MKMAFDSVCIVGVDGTGKSTLVKMVNEMFGRESSVVQYMGQKDWETKIAEIFVDHPRKVFKFVRVIAIVVEYYHRIHKHKTSEKIVIFDRYVDEIVLALRQGTTWKRRMIGVLLSCLFGNRFYQPTVTFYLTCDIETSVCRKEDINSEQQIEDLKKIKKRLDEYYMNKEGVIVINTSSNSIDETLGIIRKRLQEEFGGRYDLE